MLDIAQMHHSLGQQFQRSALSPVGSLTASEVDQLRLSFPVQASTLGTNALEASCQGDFQILLYKPLFDPNHGTATDGERLGNLPVGVAGFAMADDSFMSRTRATR